MTRERIGGEKQILSAFSTSELVRHPVPLREATRTKVEALHALAVYEAAVRQDEASVRIETATTRLASFALVLAIATEMLAVATVVLVFVTAAD